MIKKTSEEWKLESVRAFTLKEARKQARKAQRKVVIKVDGLVKVTIDGRYYNASNRHRFTYVGDRDIG